MGVDKHKVNVCFVCLKQLANLNSDKKLESSLSFSDNTIVLYSKFFNFVRKYLRVSGNDNHSASSSVEVDSFCDSCSSRVNLICELYKELCSVELRLSSKLEELGRLIKESKLEEEGMIIGRKEEEMRNSIFQKCFQKFEEISENHKEQDDDNSHRRTKEAADYDDQDIKMETESLPPPDDDEEEHGIVKIDLELPNKGEIEGGNELDSFGEYQDDSLGDAGGEDDDHHDGENEEEHPDGSYERRSLRKRKRRKTEEEIDQSGAESDSDKSFQVSEEVEDSEFEISELERGTSDEMESEQEVEFVNPLPSSTSSRQRRPPRKATKTSRSSTVRKSIRKSDPLQLPDDENPLEDNPCLCKVCGKLLETVTKLAKHLENHELKPTKKTLPCSFCSKLFIHAQSRSLHISRSHKRLSVLASATKFTCDDNRCQATFETQSDLNTHLKTHSKPIHTCSKCKAGFILPETLELHSILHVKRVKSGLHYNYPCPFPSCPVKRHYVKDLRTHYNIRHGISLAVYNCHKCNLSFGSERHFSDHLKKHEESPDSSIPISEPESALAPAPCSECGLQFLFLRALDKHRKKAHNLGPECPICHKILCARSWLLGHMKLMHKPKPEGFTPKKPGPPKKTRYFPCGDCDLVFNERSTRKTHWKSAHPPRKRKEDPCVCEVCGRSFKFRSSLSLHMNLSHRPENPDGLKVKKEKIFMCQLCGRKYSNQKCLDKHEQEHQKEGEKVPMKKSYDCHLCPQKYSTNQRRRYHLQRVHRKEKGQEFTEGEGPPSPGWKCLFPACKEEYFEENELKSHVKQEHSEEKPDFMCESCGRVFPIAQGLKRHLVTHDEKQRHNCPVCLKSFSLAWTVKEHLIAVHGEPEGLEEEELVCSHPNCGAKFKSKKYLGSHERKVHRIYRGRPKKKRTKVKVKKEVKSSDCKELST